MNKKDLEFNQILKKGCGIDVHKETVVVTVSGEGIRQETRTFSTFTNSLKEMGQWIKSKGIEHGAMESTGIYWKPVMNVLCDYVPNILLVNARHIKNVPGRKTDKKDSEWICQLLISGLLKGSFIPEERIREIRDITRYRTKLVQELSSEKNRVQKILEDANIKLSSVVSDISGVVSTKLIEGLISGRTDINRLINECYHKKLSASKAELQEALTGRITKHHIYMLKQINQHIAYLESQIKELDKELEKRTEQCNKEIILLETIPGVGQLGAIKIISEIGTDMESFPSEHHLSSWAGMCPGNNETGGKKKTSKIRHGNKYLKSTLVELAWAATRTKNTYFRSKFDKLAYRKGKKRALIAIGHMILCACYHILTKKEPFNELGMDFLEEKMKEKRIEHYAKKLKELGYKIDKIA